MHPGNAIMGEMVMTFVLVGGQAGGRMVGGSAGWG